MAKLRQEAIMINDERNLLRTQIVRRQRRYIVIVICCAALVFFSTLLFGEFLGPTKELPRRNIFLFAVSPALLGGAIGIVVAGFFAYRSRIPLVFRDFIRICCWSLMGAATGVTNYSKGYAFYCPQYRPMMETLGSIAGWTGMCGIVLASLFLSGWKDVPPGFCCHCEYDLTGLIEPRCPECGRKCDQIPSESKVR